MSKICTKCGEEKELELYGTRNNVKDGKRAACKECEKKRPVHKDFESPTSGNFMCFQCKKQKEFTEFYKNKYNKNGIRVYCKSCDLENRRIYHENNPGKEAEISKKRRDDPLQKIRMNLGSRLWQVVSKKHGNTMELTGCNTEELITYLTSKFTEGMTLHNYGKWHIDHIKPCVSFNLEDPEEQRKCFHWTNLQPLWAIDNLRKGSK